RSGDRSRPSSGACRPPSGRTRPYVCRPVRVYGSCCAPSCPQGLLLSRGAEVLGLEHLAVLDVGLTLDGVRTALDPIDSFFFGLHLEDPESADQVFRLLERPVDDRPAGARELHARALRAGLK